MHTPQARWQVRSIDEESRSFVEHVADELDCELDEAERLAVAVITTLEERLPLDDLPELEAELPRRLRELVHASDRILDLPGLEGAAFVGRVAHKLRMTDDDAARAVDAVFAALRGHLSPREVRRVHLRL